ncbi:GNAT family N-acetyltransferase, partial [Caldisericum sp.]|uniref:GNAT family N-acetyltransferase n=1 Tax=Caldisericum sp. TaxID=2499687 RepID=UPI003D13ACCD
HKVLIDFLKEVSEDFVPPLSMRGPDDIIFGSKTQNSVESYAEDLIKNYWVVFAFSSDSMVDENLPYGIISFTLKDCFSVPGKKCVYISTIAVRRKYRFLGVAERLLNFVIDFVKNSTEFKEVQVNIIETRTWSTNRASRNLFTKLGFTNTHTLQNHRGEGIDTEYYCYFLV